MNLRDRLRDPDWVAAQLARIAAAVRVTETGCWVWTKSGDGRYGHFWMGGVRYKTHVTAATLRTGLILRTRVWRHACDNAACCNPDHLTPGTLKENRQDASERGRAVGVTKATVKRARNLLTRGHSYAEVGRRLGIHATTAMRLAKGEIR